MENNENKKVGIPVKIARKIIAEILIERSNEIMNACESVCKKEEEETGYVSEYAIEIGWTSCGTRVLADDIIAGEISVEEAVREILTPEERKLAKTKCLQWLDGEYDIER